MSLTQIEANHRFDSIELDSLSYSFHLNIKNDGYSGMSEIKFTLKEISEGFFIDCSSPKVKLLLINGKCCEIKQDKNKLYLSEGLEKGENKILVQYENIFNTDERGMMNFVDVDGKQYVYSGFEPFYAHRVFALFDQSDLKASMSLSVTCPSSLTRILSNEPPILESEFEIERYLELSPTWHKEHLKNFVENIENAKMAVFNPTKPIPSFVYCVIAGPFEEIIDEPYKNIPMSWFCSSLYKPYAIKMAPFLFEITKKCMEFFEEFFGTPYAFSKYDQIFVHEMQSCAMENNGMVTYHDAEYIWTDSKTIEKALDLADTMTHELVHHWFGNLVSIKWWDDLWLKESLAEFLGYYVLEKVEKKLETVKYESSYAQLLYKKSERAYESDSFTNTHSVKCNINCTEEAETIYDGITYVKGASLMKQLVFLIGDENFSQGLKNFIQKFSYKTATIDDFFTSLQPYFIDEHNIELSEWRKVWIETTSFNILKPEWTINEHNEKVLNIHQTSYNSSNEILRPHKIKIALFKENATFDSMEIFIPATPKVSIPIDSTANYCAVLLNYEDQTYAKVAFDEESLTFFKNNFHKITDILAATQIWRIYYDLVMNGEIPSIDYLDLFTSKIGSKCFSDTIVERNFECASQCISTYTPGIFQEELNTRLFYFTLNLILNTHFQEENRLVTLRNYFIEFASGSLQLKILRKWLEGKHTMLSNYPPSTTDKWKIVHKLLNSQNIDNNDKKLILENQIQIDKTSTADLHKLRYQASIAQGEDLETTYSELINANSSQTIFCKKYVIAGLACNPNIKEFEQRYFDDISKSVDTLTSEHLVQFINGMCPGSLTPAETIEKLKKTNINKSIKGCKTIELLISKLEKVIKSHKTFEKHYCENN